MTGARPTDKRAAGSPASGCFGPECWYDEGSDAVSERMPWV